MTEFNNWVVPNFKEEEPEYKRVVEELTEEYGMVEITLELLQKQHALGKRTNLNNLPMVENTGYYIVDTRDDIAEVAEEIHDRTIDDKVEAFKSNKPMSLPIVLQIKEDWFTLVGGNTRLMLTKPLGIEPIIWLVEV